MNSFCINTTSELDLKKYTERNFPYYNYNFGCDLREVSISSKYKTIKRDFQKQRNIFFFESNRRSRKKKCYV